MRGGSATTCAARPTSPEERRDLDKFSVGPGEKHSIRAATGRKTVQDYALYYDGNWVINDRKVAKGGYGTIYKVTPLGMRVSFLCKRQEKTDTAVEALRVAATLRDCDLVEFVTFDIPPAPLKQFGNTKKRRLWTIMEQLTDDCSKMEYSERKPLMGKFCDFLERTLQCLGDSSATFPDMKLENIGIKRCRDDVNFRLIDLDGINSSVASLPITYEQRFPDNPWHATRYAFAVTAAMFSLKDNYNSRKRWYHWALGEPERRIQYFKVILGYRVKPGGKTNLLLSLIAHHALPMLLQYTAAPSSAAIDDRSASPVSVGDVVTLAPSFDRWPILQNAADAGRATGDYSEYLGVYDQLTAQLNMPNQWKVDFLYHTGQILIVNVAVGATIDSLPSTEVATQTTRTEPPS